MHPRLSPVNSGRLGYLYGTSALYHSPSQAVFNGGRLIPGSGSPEFLPGDEPRGPFRILPPLEASVASAAEFLRFAILCLRCTMPAGLAFSPASAASLLWTGHPARYPFRACHHFSMSRRPEEPFSTGLQKTLNQKRNDPSVRLSCSCPGRTGPVPAAHFFNLHSFRRAADETPCHRGFICCHSVSAPETNPSGLSCPLSRYRPGLQIFYSVNRKIRPVDRQRLLSAYPAAHAA